MKFQKLVLHAAVATALGGVSAVALAGVVVPPVVQSFSAESVASVGTMALTAPGNVYQLTGNLPIGSLITFTLQGGATFGSIPAASTTPPFAVAVFSSTATAVTYQVTTAGIAGQFISLGNFTVGNVGFMGTPADPVAGTDNVLRLAITGSAVAGSDPFPLAPGNLITLADSANSTFMGPSPGVLQNVDISTGGLKFVPSIAAPGVATATVATIGQAVFMRSPGRRIADNSAPIAFGTVEIQLTGDFSNITEVFADTSRCDKGASANRVNGTLDATGQVATLTGLKSDTPGPLYNICLTANGTGVIAGLDNGINATATARYTNAATVQTFGVGVGGFSTGFAPVAPGTSFGMLRYNGRAGNSRYVVGGTSGGYSTFIRAGNNTSAAQQVFATVQADDGTVTTGSLGELGGNQATLYTTEDLNTATGSTLTTETDRANVWLFMTGPNASFGTITLNPDASISGTP